MDPLTDEEVREIEAYLEEQVRTLPENSVTGMNLDRKKGQILHTHADGTVKRISARGVLIHTIRRRP